MVRLVKAFGRWVVASIVKFIMTIAGLAVLFVLLVTGTSVYHDFTYARADAVVTGRSALCEASYYSGRYSKTRRILPCVEVPSLKAKFPEVTWSVEQVVVVSLSYPVGVERQNATIKLSELGGHRDVAVGQSLAILYSPGDPKSVAAPTPANELIGSGIVLVVGLSVLVLPTFVSRWRRRRLLPQVGTPVAGPFGPAGKRYS